MDQGVISVVSLTGIAIAAGLLAIAVLATIIYVAIKHKHQE